MKKISNYFFTFFFVLVFIVSACEKEEDDNNNPNTPNSDTTSGLTNDHWFYDFDGTIDGGEGFDVIKSSVDGKIYICGAFLHVNNNSDMKNLTRWVPSSNTWEQVPGIDYYHSNFIRSITEDNEGNLYFGGDFSLIGGVTAGRVARFNVLNGEWSNLRDIDFYIEEEQYGPISGGTYAIAFLDDYIYIGGGIYNSDSVELRYIRRFNLSENKWEAVGTGVNGRVRCLTVDGNGNLFAGGEFTEAGGTSVNYIAKWTGTAWERVGEGCDNYVLALEYANGKLYAGGSFKFVGNEVRAQGIAMWNGAEWEAMEQGIYASWGNTYSVHGIAVDTKGKVYIGGYFDKKYSDGDTLNHVGVFIDDKWWQLGEGLATTSSQGVHAMMADGDDIYFVGYFSKGNLDPNVKINTAIWKSEE